MILAGGLSQTVRYGPFVFAALLAALVGAIAFLSPCVLPLVPGYLAYVAGLSGAEDRPTLRRSVFGAGAWDTLVYGANGWASKFTSGVGSNL